METNTNQAQNNGSTQQENKQQQVQVQETQSSASSAKSQSDEPKFTQRDLDAILRDRVNGLNAKIADLNSQLSAEKSKVADLTSKVEDFTNKDLVSKQQIPEQFADFAIFEAKKLTADGKKSFEEAIKEIAQKNASMFGIQTSNGASQSQGNPNQVQGRQPVITVGNTNTQGNNNNSGTIDQAVQAFLESKKKRR